MSVRDCSGAFALPTASMHGPRDWCGVVVPSQQFLDSKVGPLYAPRGPGVATDHASPPEGYP